MVIVQQRKMFETMWTNIEYIICSRQDGEENFREHTHIFAHTYDITKILKLVRNEASVENTCMRENMEMLCKRMCFLCSCCCLCKDEVSLITVPSIAIRKVFLMYIFTSIVLVNRVFNIFMYTYLCARQYSWLFACHTAYNISLKNCAGNSMFIDINMSKIFWSC